MKKRFCKTLLRWSLRSGPHGRGAEYGEARLASHILNSPLESASEVLEDVVARVNTFVGAASQHDDITHGVLRIKA